MKKIDKIIKFLKENIKLISKWVHENEKLAAFILFLIYSVILFQYIPFSRENFCIYFNSLLIFVVGYLLLYKLQKVENFIQNKITYIIILFIFLLIFFQGELGITNKDTLIMGGSMFAFWYGYKKYERDKEIEVISIYTKKYQKIKENHKNSKNTKDDLEIYFSKLFNLWREEFHLYDKGYISEKIWKLWKKFIKININKLLLTISSNSDYLNILIQQIVNEKVSINYIEYNNFIKIVFTEIYNDNSKLLYSVIRKHSELKKLNKSDLTGYDKNIIEDIFNNTKLRELGNLNDEDLMFIFKQNIKSNTLIKVNILNNF